MSASDSSNFHRLNQESNALGEYLMREDFPIGQRIRIPGHFNEPVVLESVAQSAPAMSVESDWPMARRMKPFFPR